MKKNSEKRNRKIELSDEAMALRKMRDYRSMSVRDVGDVLNVSFTTVSHMENGRATIHEEYLKKILKALKFSLKDFEKFCEGSVKFESLRTKFFFADREEGAGEAWESLCNVGFDLDYTCRAFRWQCLKEKWKPVDHHCKGNIIMITGQWCISSCTGFAWTIKHFLRDKVKVIGMPESGDSTYSRAYLTGSLLGTDG